MSFWEIHSHHAGPPGEDLRPYLRYLRHIVIIEIALRRGEISGRVMVSTFLMSVNEQWFLITAGHCVRDIRDRIAEGWQIEYANLHDTGHSDAPHAHAVPFDYTESHPIDVSELHAEFDYGVIALRPAYQRLLFANKARALDERSWKNLPESFDDYIMVGIPGDLVIGETSESVTYSYLSLPLEKLDARPKRISERATPHFYGRILGELPTSPETQRAISIKGMSGCPILGIREVEGGFRYWLVAVQSVWHRPTKSIAACPSTTIGEILEELIRLAFTRPAP